MAAPVATSTALRSKTGDSCTMPVGTTDDRVTERATVLATLPGLSVMVALPSALVAEPPAACVTMAWPGPGMRGVAAVAPPAPPAPGHRGEGSGRGGGWGRWVSGPPVAVSPSFDAHVLA